MSIQIQSIENLNVHQLDAESKKAVISNTALINAFNAKYPVGSFFVYEGEAVKTVKPACLNKKGLTYINVEDLSPSERWYGIEINELHETIFLGVLREFIESPENNTVELTQGEFDALELVAFSMRDSQDSDRFAFENLSIWQGNNGWWNFAKDGKIIEFVNMDADSEDGSESFSDDDLSWLKNGNCRD